MTLMIGDVATVIQTETDEMIVIDTVHIVIETVNVITNQTNIEIVPTVIAIKVSYLVFSMKDGIFNKNLIDFLSSTDDERSIGDRRDRRNRSRSRSHSRH